MLLFSTTEPHACPTINPSQSVLSEGSSYGAHWCSQLLPQSITHTGWPVHGRKCGIHFTMQFGDNRHPFGEPHLESACATSSRAGTASVAGAGLYSYKLGREAMTMEERGDASVAGAPADCHHASCPH